MNPGKIDKYPGLYKIIQKPLYGDQNLLAAISTIYTLWRNGSGNLISKVRKSKQSITQYSYNMPLSPSHFNIFVPSEHDE